MKTTDHLEPPIKMEGVEFGQVCLRHPFVAHVPVSDEWLLYVIRGEGIALHAPDKGIHTGPMALGTVIGMSGNDVHYFTSADYDAKERIAAKWQEMPLGTPTAPDEIVVAVSRTPQSAMPFLSMMGGYIRIDPAEQGDTVDRIGALLDWIADETGRADSVTGEIVLRMAEIITIEIGRVGRAQSIVFSQRPSGAEFDARVWRAILAISNQPEQRWTVDSMAQIAGMSRSAFAARYHETVGQTPLRSLRRLRMHRAAMVLASSATQVIAPLADALGYGSDAAFNRAFTKEFGYPPKRYSQRTTTSFKSSADAP